MDDSTELSGSLGYNGGDPDAGYVGSYSEKMAMKKAYLEERDRQRRAAAVGLPPTATLEQIEQREGEAKRLKDLQDFIKLRDRKKRATAVGLPITATIEEIEAKEEAERLKDEKGGRRDLRPEPEKDKPSVDEVPGPPKPLPSKPIPVTVGDPKTTDSTELSNNRRGLIDPHKPDKTLNPPTEPDPKPNPPKPDPIKPVPVEPVTPIHPKPDPIKPVPVEPVTPIHPRPDPVPETSAPVDAVPEITNQSEEETTGVEPSEEAEPVKTKPKRYPSSRYSTDQMATTGLNVIDLFRVKDYSSRFGDVAREDRYWGVTKKQKMK